MPSIFTRIVEGEIPCHKIAETEEFFAFLDIRPLAKGHTLCIPKKEVDYLFDLDDETLQGLSVFSKKVAGAIERVVDCQRVGVIVVGTEVPHAHIHLIPFKAESQVNLGAPKIEMNQEEMAALAERIRSAF